MLGRLTARFLRTSSLPLKLKSFCLSLWWTTGHRVPAPIRRVRTGPRRLVRPTTTRGSCGAWYRTESPPGGHGGGRRGIWKIWAMRWTGWWSRTRTWRTGSAGFWTAVKWLREKMIGCGWSPWVFGPGFRIFAGSWPPCNRLWRSLRKKWKGKTEKGKKKQKYLHSTEFNNWKGGKKRKKKKKRLQPETPCIIRIGNEEIIDAFFATFLSVSGKGCFVGGKKKGKLFSLCSISQFWFRETSSERENWSQIFVI